MTRVSIVVKVMSEKKERHLGTAKQRGKTLQRVRPARVQDMQISEAGSRREVCVWICRRWVEEEHKKRGRQP